MRGESTSIWRGSSKAPIAIEAIERIDALFAIEREINGTPPEHRLAVRQERSRPLMTELESCMRQQRAKLSPKSETAKAIDYSLKRWPAFTRFLDDGRLCMSNNAAEREIRADSRRPSQLDLRRLRRRRQPRRRDVHAHQHSQAQRRRSASLAR